MGGHKEKGRLALGDDWSQPAAPPHYPSLPAGTLSGPLTSLRSAPPPKVGNDLPPEGCCGIPVGHIR